MNKYLYKVACPIWIFVNRKERYIWMIDAFRYSRHDKRSKLPGWILSHLRDAHLNLSTDMAIHIAKEVAL